MREVAAAALAHLAVVLNKVPPDQLRLLVEAGELGPPTPPPWDDYWSSDSRTASWRS